MTASYAAEHYGAQMYLPKGDDPDTAMLYYRWHTQILHTGEFRTSLEYLSHCNLWQGSFDRDQKALVARLIQIPGVPVHDAKEAEKAILAGELKRLGRDEFDRLQALRAQRKREDEAWEARKRRPPDRDPTR